MVTKHINVLFVVYIILVKHFDLVNVNSFTYNELDPDELMKTRQQMENASTTSPCSISFVCTKLS